MELLITCTRLFNQVIFQIASSRYTSRSSLLWMRMEKRTMEFSSVRMEKKPESMAGPKDSNIAEGGLLGQCSGSRAGHQLMCTSCC